MGYYSNLAIDDDFDSPDCSYTSPQMQLMWRLEDLQERLEKLTEKRRINEDRVTFSEDDLRYVLPKAFVTAGDVKAAINLAICDLQERYGIVVCEEKEKETPAVEEISCQQISFMDILMVCPLNAA